MHALPRRLTAAALAMCLALCLSLPAGARERPVLRVPVLMYHHIEEKERYNTVTVSPQRFEEDMVFLQSNGFTPLLPADVEAIAAGEMPLPARPVMITFDDGYESNYLEAFPVLQKTGMKATICLIAMLVQGEGRGAKWTLSWDQCREMYQSGLVDFGSHTWNLHNPDNGLNFKAVGPNGIQRLEDETQEAYIQRVGDDLAVSVAAIEANLGNTVRMFAYPFGATDSWAAQLLAQVGITQAVTTKKTTADLGGDLLALPRYRVDMGTPLSQMRAIKALLEVPLPQPEEPALPWGPDFIQRLADILRRLNQAARPIGRQ